MAPKGSSKRVNAEKHNEQKHEGETKEEVHADEEEESSDQHDDSESDGSEGSDDSQGDEEDEDSDSFPSNSDEDEQEDSDDDGERITELQVDFQFFNPEEKDFLGLKSLLSSYLNSMEFDSSGMIDAIIAEGDIGSVVKTDDDDDPVAIMTVLSTAKYSQTSFMKQIKQFLMDACPEQAAKDGVKVSELLRKSLEAAGTGLIVNDRYINAPPKLGPPLVTFLMNAVQERSKPGAAPLTKDYQFERFLVFTRVYVDQSDVPSGNRDKAAEGAGGGYGRPTKKQRREMPVALPTDEIVFAKPEDQFMHQHSAWHFLFPVVERPLGKDGLQMCRLVMQVDGGAMPAAQRELDRIVGNMFTGDPGEEVAGAAAQADAGDGSGSGSGSGPGAKPGKKASGFKAKAVKM